MVAATGLTDPVLTRMVAEDKVPWYKKPNLRVMYIYLFLCCCGVEMTSGFDSQLINTLVSRIIFVLCDYMTAYMEIAILWTVQQV